MKAPVVWGFGTDAVIVPVEAEAEPAQSSDNSVAVHRDLTARRVDPQDESGIPSLRYLVSAFPRLEGPNAPRREAHLFPTLGYGLGYLRY